MQYVCVVEMAEEVHVEHDTAHLELHPGRRTSIGPQKWLLRPPAAPRAGALVFQRRVPAHSASSLQMSPPDSPPPERVDRVRAVHVELAEQASGLVPAHTVEERAGQPESQEPVGAHRHRRREA
jgi:hypothetical protein